MNLNITLSEAENGFIIVLTDTSSESEYWIAKDIPEMRRILTDIVRRFEKAVKEE